MRVLHIITDTNIGGAGRYLLNLLIQPAFDDTELVVACPDGALGQRLDSIGMRRVNISGRDVSFSTGLVGELCRVMRDFRPDIVHTHSSLSGRMAARIARIPVVYTKHNLVRLPDAKGVVPPRAGTAKRLVNKASARLLADRVIGVSLGVEKDLVESGVDPKMVVAIPNGIDLSPFPKEYIMGKKTTESGMLIGTVARLHRQKALEVMLEAFKMVLSSDPSVRFVIGGTGPLKEEIKAKIGELRLEPYVRMAGFIEDVPGFLSKLDVYALSSDYEGLPLAVLEAMAAGLPIAATAVGGVPEAVVDGVTGFLVPPRQPRALAQAITRMVVDPGLARKMGLAARQRVEDLFDAKVMAQKTKEVYLGVVR